MFLVFLNEQAPKDYAPALPTEVPPFLRHILCKLRERRWGAADFILKPWQNDKLVAAVEGAVQRGQMRRAASGSKKTVQQNLQQELEYASEVQQRLFPQNPPQLETLDYWAVCKAARGVGTI